MNSIYILILLFLIFFSFFKSYLYLKKEKKIYKYLTLFGLLYIVEVSLAAYLIDSFSLFQGINDKYDFEMLFYEIALWSFYPAVFLMIIGLIWWGTKMFAKK
ncbi:MULTISPECIES: hypothetical protein [Flavobacterium]|uniref:hypothetical protein n=1 Tax=Flavobacterium TaxID=237 RepID=UPI0011843342|nr:MULTISPECIES: hypothetical protein [Flavobacterium]MCR4033655.1 hypothetical protein [Flavobacterium panacis]